MTVAIPAVTFPSAGTGRDMTGHRPASGLLVIMAGPVAPPPGPGSQPVPPRWSRDRSGLWLRNAAAGLCVLAAAAAAVSFTAQYRMVDATRHLPVVAALEAAIPDAAALVFACLGIALALHGRRAIRARALNLASVAASVFMNAIAAAPGWRNLAIWAMPPVAYALASDTLITVVRARHQQLAADAATPLAILGGLILWLLRLALAPVSTLAGFRAWVLEECPVAPGRRAARPAPPSAAARPGPGGGTVPRKATKTGRFLSLVTERHGPLASIPLDRVASISAALAPAADLNPGAARAALRKAVLPPATETPHDAQVRHRPGRPDRPGRGVRVGVPARPAPARQPGPAPADPAAPAAAPGQGLRPPVQPVAALGPLRGAAPLGPDPRHAPAVVPDRRTTPALGVPRPGPLPAPPARPAGRAPAGHGPAADLQDRIPGRCHPALPRPGHRHHHQGRRVPADRRGPRRAGPGARVQPAAHRRRRPRPSAGTRSRDARTRPPRSAAPTRSRSPCPRRASRTARSGPPKPRTTCAATSTPPPWPATTCAPSRPGWPAPTRTSRSGS